MKVLPVRKTRLAIPDRRGVAYLGWLHVCAFELHASQKLRRPNCITSRLGARRYIYHNSRDPRIYTHLLCSHACDMGSIPDVIERRLASLEYLKRVYVQASLMSS